ncbi:hypothetical protein ACLOJK_021001 [Asimina triloba]
MGNTNKTKGKAQPEQASKTEEQADEILQAFWFKDKSKWENYLKDSRKTCQLIVVNCTTKWCRPYQEAAKGIKELIKGYKDVKFASIDIDHLLDVAKDLDVKMMPTFLLLKRKEGGTNGTKKGSSGNAGSEKGKEGSGKDHGSQKGEEGSGKEGSQKGKESGKDGSQKGQESEMKNFNVVGRVEGWKEKELKDEIQKHSLAKSKIGKIPMQPCMCW